MMLIKGQIFGVWLNPKFRPTLQGTVGLEQQGWEEELLQRNFKIANRGPC